MNVVKSILLETKQRVESIASYGKTLFLERYRERNSRQSESRTNVFPS